MTLYHGDTVVRASGTDAIGSPDSRSRRRPRSCGTAWSRRTPGRPGGTTTRPARRCSWTTPSQDGDGAGKAGRYTGIAASPSHLPGGPGSGSVRKAGVDVSYDDGATGQANGAHSDGARPQAGRARPAVDAPATPSSTPGSG
ncbi:hypothetical protein [Streptomyces sp. NBC_01217]|uniref:hypothetical protein n=1 Tax=Streptomyces sp. NBC_01217 TaxID=2903779 RepID=UPI002E0F8326|nr:hypothetical protein OG507_04185 [Streptomyces sp. NBC_01217]